MAEEGNCRYHRSKNKKDTGQSWLNGAIRMEAPSDGLLSHHHMSSLSSGRIGPLSILRLFIPTWLTWSLSVSPGSNKGPDTSVPHDLWLIVFSYIISSNDWSFVETQYVNHQQNEQDLCQTQGCPVKFYGGLNLRICQCQVVRKPVNVNPGLNVNCNITFSCLKMFYTSAVWCSLSVITTAQDCGANDINRTPHHRVTKLKSKFSLTLG